MKNALVVTIFLFSALGLAQTQSSADHNAQAISTNLKVAPDLDQRLAKWRQVKMPFNGQALSPRERKLVEKLVEASRYIEDIYWRQSDPEALTLYESLLGSTHPQDEKLRHFIFINASRFDLLDDNRPFVGVEPMPPGRGFYPQGLTREEIEA